MSETLAEQEENDPWPPPAPVESRLEPMPADVRFGGGVPEQYVRFTGVCVEGDRIWTDGPAATLSFRTPFAVHDRFGLRFEICAFTWPDLLDQQTVVVSIEDSIVARWTLLDREPTTRAILLPKSAGGGDVTIHFSVPTCRRPAALGINSDHRELGIAFTAVGLTPVVDPERFSKLTRQYGRRVGPESRKTFDRKLESGFWGKYVTGPNVLDIGFRGRGIGHSSVVPIVEGAIGVDLDFPGYDGKTLPFSDGSQDAVYSSHCLEHITHYIKTIQEWYRVTKIGGHIIVTVPNALLYERKRTPPSSWNADHQRFYTPSSLLMEFERALLPNSYRVRYLSENDRDFNYSLPQDVHPGGCYEIELVIQKIEMPAWRLGD